MATPIPSNDVRLDARDVAAATGGRIVGPLVGRTARGVTTDSRRVTPGCAFVALRGERHDGHDHIDAALRAGAALLVVEPGRAPSGPEMADVVEVTDTLAAWGAIARTHLRRWRAAGAQARLVGITGSAGKTTTKELCAALLRTAGSCHATKGNLNNRIGLPAVALEVGPQTRFVVLEMGMSVPGEIAALSAIAQPDVGVVTNVGLAHAAGVGGTIADVAFEKGAIFAAVGSGGVLVANGDDSAVVGQLRRNVGARVVTFGAGPDADYGLASRRPVGAGSAVTVRRRGGDGVSCEVPIPGRAAAIDFVAALAAAEAAAGTSFSDADVHSAMGTVSSLPGRMHLRRLGRGVWLLDDSYNASPATMRAALATLAETSEGRRVAVLGEMKELGPAAPAEHAFLGAAVAEAGVALLVTCGGLAEAIGREAERRGVEVVRGENVGEAARIVIERLRPADAVLVKASRSVGADRVVDALVRSHGEESG